MSYEAGHAAVHLQHALGAAVALARLSVGAEPGALAAPRLVSGEATLTSSTAEGALQREGGRMVRGFCCSAGGFGGVGGGGEGLIMRVLP